MKILFVTNSLEMGGIETNLVRLTKALTQRGCDVLAATGGGSLEAAFSEAGGRHHRVGLTPHQFPSSVRRIAHVIRDEAPDVIHAFSAPAAVAVTSSRLLWGRRRRQFPLRVSSVMGLQSAPDEHSFMTRVRVLATCFGSKKIIVIAPSIGDVIATLPIATSRLVFQPVVGVETPVNVSTEHFASARALLSLDPLEQMVLTIGNLEPRKSHELFVRAAAQVAAKRPNVRFFIAGAGPLRHQLEGHIRSLGLQERVVLLGERKDIDNLLAAADVYVRPGVVEGFIGITVLEAQARGRAVVSFETEDVKLAIEDGLTGRLVPVGDTEAMAAAIQLLLDDPKERCRIGLEGQNQVTNRFSVDAVAEGLLALYRHEIDRKTA